MKLPLSWIRDYISFSASPEEISSQLTMQGLEIDAIHQIKEIEGIIIGEVISCTKHPNADKLSVCRVNTGDRELQVVCGAPNVLAGIKVALATVGTQFPQGLKIQKAKLRGMESEGMICSEKELGLSEDASGIMILPPEAETGKPFWDQIPKKEAVLEVAITPNRGDCLCMIGLAREIAAIGGEKVKYPEISLKGSAVSSADKIKIIIHEPEACPRYVGKYFSNIKIGHSPDWMAQRLTEAGMRPINNVVDITNYVMLETGQPLHAFDYRKLAKTEINIRLAKKDEKFMTLDNKERTLNREHLLICDGEKAVALAGIMGGLCSEVDENTTEILLESAYFNPVTVRIGAKKLGLSSEAAYRFERGTDPNGCAKAADRAAELLEKYAHAKIAKDSVDV
jgi:phenylalanyl-tRNA synthetase beta chain